VAGNGGSPVYVDGPWSHRQVTANGTRFHIAESGVSDLCLEVGMFGAEPWSAAMRTEIEARLGLRAIDIYGLSEIMGPGVACECQAE
jgi:phenylacetate-coenzyme A ligase PaaK-like adenylate-forming protein